MNYKQRSRIEKLKCERFYLLNINVLEGDTISLDVSGSSRNIYQIELKDRKIQCNCPDQKGWAKQYNCICKHSCFIIQKVCRDIITDESEFWTNLEFNEQEYQVITDILKEKSRNFEILDDETVDKELVEKFNQINISESKYETEKTFNEGDVCPICYDDGDTDLLECPDCKNIFHKECMERWLQTQNTCVYCRSTVWNSYSEKGEYLNLGF